MQGFSIALAGRSGGGHVLTQKSSFLWALVALEIITIAGFFLVLSSQRDRNDGRNPHTVVDLLGIDEKTISPFRGDLMPPPEVLAKDIVYNSSFLQSNDLKAYLASFPPIFAEHLLSLGPEARVLDAGAGEALFAEQLVGLRKDPSPELRFADKRDVLFRRLIDRNERPHVVAVDVEIKRRSIPNYGGKLEILSGRLFEEIPDSLLGKFDMIVDNQGVFAYSPHLDEVLKRYLAELKPHGVIYLALGPEQTSFAYLSRVQTRERGSMRLVDWIGAIAGLRANFGYADRDRRALVIERAGQVRVPALKLVSVEPRGSEPPVRVYSQEQ